MKKLILKYALFVLCLFVSLFAMAQDTVLKTDTVLLSNAAKESIKSVSANYSTMVLTFLSILGVLAHLLNDLIKEKQKPAPYVYTWGAYWSKSWPSLALSLVICMVVIIVRHEMFQIPDFSNWEGLFMALLGFVGSSIIGPIINVINKRSGLNITQP